MKLIWALALMPGMAAAQVVDCNNAVAQVEMTFCAEQDWKTADADLNAAYGAARGVLRAVDAGLPVNQRGAEAALRDAQRAWITYRDKSCTAESYMMYGGSAAPMVFYICSARVTSARAGDLWGLAEGN